MLRVLAPYSLPVDSVPGAPLTAYLRAQQLAACAGKSPGAAAQRTYVNGDGSGGFNTGMFLKQNASGFDSFDVDAFLVESPASCAGRVYISAHHYLNPCGNIHAGGVLVDTDTVKQIGSDTELMYDPTPYTGTIVKLLPEYADFYLEADQQIPCFARMKNTTLGAGELWWTQPVNAFAVGPDGTGVSTYQFTPEHPLYEWQQQYTDYFLSIGGDSGSPVFCGIYGEPVLISFVAVGSYVGFDRFHRLLTQITIKMRELAAFYSDPDAATYAPQTVPLNVYFAA